MELSLGDYLKNSLILPHNPKLHLYFFFLIRLKVRSGLSPFLFVVVLVL